MLPFIVCISYFVKPHRRNNEVNAMTHISGDVPIKANFKEKDFQNN
jgi:hypothetical protein